MSIAVPIERSRFICRYNTIISQDKSWAQNWVPSVFLGCRMPKSYSVLRVNLVIHHWQASGSRRLTFWEFYDQSWTMDKSPTLCGCVMPKLERSISDRKSGAILQPIYSWICPGSARQTQAKCFTLHYFTCNHTYWYRFPDSFSSSVFCLKFKQG